MDVQKWRDAAVAPRWIRDLPPVVRNLFLLDQNNRRALRAIRLGKVVQAAVLAAQTLLVAATYKFFPPTEVLTALSTGSRLAAVVPSVAIFTAGAVANVGLMHWSMRSLARFAARMSEQSDRLVRDLRSGTRGQHELDDGNLQQLKRFGDVMYETINGPWRRSSNNTAVAVGTLLGTFVVLGLAGSLTMLTAAPIFALAGVVMTRLVRDAKVQTQALQEYDRARAEFEATRTTRRGIESALGLGIDMAAGERHGHSLYQRELKHRSARTTGSNRVDLFWNWARDGFFVFGIAVTAAVGLPASTIAAMAFSTGLLSLTLGSIFRDRALLFDAAASAGVIERVAERNREFHVSRGNLEQQAISPEWDGSVSLLDVRTERMQGDSAPVSLHFPRGSLVVLAGQNGAGKTSLMKVIRGLRVPTSGDVFYGDQRIGSLDPESLRVNTRLITPQTDPLLAMDLLHTAAPDRRRAMLDQVGIPRPQGDLLARDPSARVSLSTGQQTRLAMLSLLVGTPKVVLLDEFDVCLDGDGRAQLTDLVLQLKASGSTVIAATNTTGDLLAVADRFVLLGADGSVLADGSPHELVFPHVEPGLCADSCASAAHEWVQSMDQLRGVRIARQNLTSDGREAGPSPDPASSLTD